MIKRNEGYALSYVLVILLVLALIAVSVLSPPLRNLQNQQASIARMQEKYSAQGKVEMIVAQLESATPESLEGIINTVTAANTDNTTCTKDSVSNTFYITATSENTVANIKATITATVTLKEPIEGETNYSVTYTSYNVEVMS